MNKMENQNKALSLSRGSLSGKRNSMGSIPIPSSIDILDIVLKISSLFCNIAEGKVVFEA
jgi:hypothetical protein